MFPSQTQVLNELTSNESINVRQSNDDSEHFSRFDNGNFRYTTLINRSPSNISLNTVETETDNNNLNVDNSSKMVKSNSDQKIPDNSDKSNNHSKNTYYYVNKNGFPIQSQVVTSPKRQDKDLAKEKFLSEKSPLICTDLLLEVYKTNKENLTDSNKLENDKGNYIGNQERQSVGRSVPSHVDNQTLSSLDLSSNSLVQRDSNGNVIINTNLAIQEPNIELNSDHIKYINIFSILCCWCFPITGILTIIFARLTKKYYYMSDIVKAKKFLNRAEWMLMLTFFFGCTLIAVLFALMEAFWFKTGSNNSINRGNVFHTRSLPK